MSGESLDASGEFSQGFLSPSVSLVRDEIRRRYAELRSLLFAVNRECVEAQHCVELQQSNTRAMLAALYYSRTLSSTQGAVLLLEHGMGTQARTVLRSALETLFVLCALYRKPEIADVIVAGFDADKRTIADRVFQWQSDDLRQSILSHVPEDELRSYLKNKAPKLDAFKLAEAADMKEWYFTFYTLLSFPAHGSVSDLQSKHVVLSNDGEVECLKNEPEIEGQAPTWQHAIQFLLRAAEAFQGVFGVQIVAVDQHVEKLGALMGVEPD